MVDKDGGMRFFAGVPLVGSSGHRLGMLSIIDARPRRVTADQVAVLVNMSGEWPFRTSFDCTSWPYSRGRHHIWLSLCDCDSCGGLGILSARCTMAAVWCGCRRLTSKRMSALLS